MLDINIRYIAFGSKSQENFFKDTYNIKEFYYDKDTLINSLQRKDVIYVTNLELLISNVKQFLEIIPALKDNECRLLIVEEDVPKELNFSNGTCDIDKLIGSLQQVYDYSLSENIKKGRTEAISHKGKINGRPTIDYDRIPKDFKEAYKKFKDGDIMSLAEVGRQCGMSKHKAYRYRNIVDEYEASNK